jgi:16S rRNA (cytidine1402-2'-O)-methyltransferase
MGLMSEACPGVADPGAVIVKLAHEKAFKLFLSWTLIYSFAMMASEWTKFYFHGYLPIEKTKKSKL